MFRPLALRGLTVRNRVWLAPMCQYSAVEGVPGDWHLVHLAARAHGGFGLLLTEATAVVPEGRITPQDTGLWSDEQEHAWARVVDVVHAAGAPVAVQLAHAGRKASTYRPWDTRRGTVPPEDGGWPTVAPSAVAFEGYAEPTAMTTEQVQDVVRAFADAAARADRAGFDAVEVHAAHGYLLHQFLSPLSNHRADAYGGTPENRARLLREVVAAVRAAWPEDKPVLVRVSATDWVEGGLTPDDVAAALVSLDGVDLVDVSSGGLVPATIPVGTGYQVPLARHVGEVTGLPVSAVGLLTDATEAEAVLVAGDADAVMVGRAALRDPMWPLRAAHELGVPVAPDGPAPWPAQYLRGTFAG
ncbi:NADH:flavin oxidoreductase/NADH oxidase [Cellulomonas carbonis]|uniref:NADH:flavin oxidoreductase/NADH oxidase n=1 Tax=Cellulomonas carbonis TaxID=1386092 RepID=UPI0005B7720C|nr:NADH:flavin oxidoreductase/NADH oxidase [Cellulomonas carbonis]